MSLADHTATKAQGATSTLWDELLHADGRPRKAAAPLVDHLKTLGVSELEARQDAADLDMLAMGVTFTVCWRFRYFRHGEPGGQASAVGVAESHSAATTTTSENRPTI